MDRGSWHCMQGSDQTIPKKKKGKRVVWGDFTNSWRKKRREIKRERERYTQLNAELQRIPRRDKKALLSDQCKETEENNRMEKTRDLFKKIRDTKGTFHTKMDTIKDRNGMELTRTEDITKRWQEYTEELYKKILMSQITNMVWSLTYNQTSWSVTSSEP